MCKFCYQAQRQGGMFSEDDPLFGHVFDHDDMIMSGGDNLQASLAKNRSPSSNGFRQDSQFGGFRPPSVPSAAQEKQNSKPSVPNLFGAAKVKKVSKNSLEAKKSKKNRLAKIRAIRSQAEMLIEELYGIKEPTLTIAEVQCLDPECPDLELMIATVGNEENTHRFRIGVPMMKCTANDIEEAIRAIHSGKWNIPSHSNNATASTKVVPLIPEQQQVREDDTKNSESQESHKTVVPLTVAAKVSKPEIASGAQSATGSSWRFRKANADEFGFEGW